jgi:hypothetical protein
LLLLLSKYHTSSADSLTRCLYHLLWCSFPCWMRHYLFRCELICWRWVHTFRKLYLLPQIWIECEPNFRLRTYTCGVGFFLFLTSVIAIRRCIQSASFIVSLTWYSMQVPLLSALVQLPSSIYELVMGVNLALIMRLVIEHIE